jgi:sulfur-oxidizing protein SoxY
MHQQRRRFLVITGAGAAALSGLLPPISAEAATWNKAGFESKALNDAIKSLGAANATETRDISITAPDIAENGAVVPVAIQSRIPNTQSIAILAEKNPFPLAATFDIAESAEPYASVRLKLGETTHVRAIVKAGGKFYTASKEVKVTVGGCG